MFSKNTCSLSIHTKSCKFVGSKNAVIRRDIGKISLMKIKWPLVLTHAHIRKNNRDVHVLQHLTQRDTDRNSYVYPFNIGCRNRFLSVELHAIDRAWLWNHGKTVHNKTHFLLPRADDALACNHQAALIIEHVETLHRGLYQALPPASLCGRIRDTMLDWYAINYRHRPQCPFEYECCA